MAVATEILEVGFDLQLSGDQIDWSYAVIEPEQADMLSSAATIRAMYSRLARQYDSRPSVQDSGGGLPGDLIPL